MATRPGNAALAQVLALLAIGLLVPTMPTPTGWLLAAVGIANNANTYWLLAAGCWLRARWPEGGGGGPGQGANGNGGFTNKIF